MTLKVNDIHLALMLDIGAPANVISLKKIIPKPNLQAAKVIVRGYLGAEIQVNRKCIMRIHTRTSSMRLKLVQCECLWLKWKA